MYTVSAQVFSFNYFLHVFTIFLLLGSLFSLVVGIGILLQSHLIFRLINFTNQFVSTRQAIKPVEIQRSVEPALYRQRKLLGTAVMLGALIALGLLLSKSTEARVLLLMGGGAPTAKQIWIASSVKWLLVIGNAVCLVVGVLLHFYPETLARIEAVVNRWVSVRKHTSVMERMYLGVDNWVINHPVISGSFIVFLSLNIAVVMYTHL